MNRKKSDFGLRDGELVRRAQGGAAEAFAELVARYQDRVYNTCYRLCHNHDDALDLTQTTFVRALENLPRFEAQGRVLYLALPDCNELGPIGATQSTAASERTAR